MTTPWEQGQLLRDVADGLRAAFDEEDWDHEELDPIRFNKLLYRAVDHFDLPVTYRWYKYGSDFTQHGLTVDDHTQPAALQELPSPDEPRIETIEDDHTPPTPREYRDFFVSEFSREFFENDTKEYLESFYQDYAPEELTDLYMACAVFQKTLDSIGHSTDPGSKTTEHIDTILSELDELNREVLLYPAIADVDSEFHDYSGLLEDILITVDDLEGELDAWQEEIYKNVIRFFYEKAWKLVALKIAIERTNGPSAIDWRERDVRRFSSMASSYDEELAQLAHQSARAGLIADEFLQYQEPRPQQANNDRLREIEEQVAEDWSTVSADFSPDI